MDRSRLQAHIESSLEALKAHDLPKARKNLDAALAIDYEDSKVVGMLKYVGFWAERQRFLESLHDNFEKSDYLLQQWAQFQVFQKRVGLDNDEVNYALRQLVFGRALNLLSVYNNEAGAHDPEVLWRAGICLKEIGNYDTSRRFLESANSFRRDSPAIMADLADAYALVDEPSLAKVFMREALFINPQEIRPETFESEMFVRLLNSVRELGFSGPELMEWLPVYGQLMGVLTVKRELRSIEYGKLQQNIYNLEREYQEHIGNPTLQVPRLINRYFWLIDHYIQVLVDHKKIQEVLLKIRSLSPKIHELYTK